MLKSCVKENETAQNFAKMKTAEQEKKVTENDKVNVQPSYVTINATAVLEKSPNVKFVDEEWGSLLRFLGSTLFFFYKKPMVWAEPRGFLNFQLLNLIFFLIFLNFSEKFS